MNRDKLVFLLAAIFVLSSAAYGQHYEFIRTDTNASNLIQNATINDESLVAGDEIAVFTPGGVCAGAVVVQDGEPPVGCTAFGDDAQTQEVDGFRNGEAIEYRIWDARSEREIVAEPTFRVGRVTWAVNQFNVLDLAAVVEDEGPEITFASSFNTPGSARDVFVLGNYAYVADWEGGLSIIDVADPANPESVGVYNTAGSAAAVTVSGNYAYVADFANGLVILDVSDPADITLVGHVDTPGSAADVIIAGNYAIVADWASGVQFVNISDPTEPEIVANVRANGNSVNMVLQGSILFVTVNSTGLFAYDVSNMEAPELMGSLGLSSAYGLDVIGDLAYVSRWATGVTVVDVSDAREMQTIGTYDTAGEALNIATYGDFAFVSDRNAGLAIVNVADLEALEGLATYNTDGEARTTQLVGEYAYVADWTAGLVILDVSQVTALDESGAMMTYAPAVLNYGDVQVGTEVEFDVLVANKGGALLELFDVFTDGHGFAVSFDAMNLLPGQNVLIPVVFVPENVGEVDGRLVIATNANDAELGLFGAGVNFEIPTLEFDPEFLEFGEVEVGDEGQLVLTITNNGNDEVQVVSVMSDNEVFYTDFENEPAGPRFQFRQTDVSHSLLVQETNLNGEPLQIDDEIGVFTEGGLCGGAATVVEVGAQLGLGAFGDDAQTQEVDGFRANEALEFRFWDASAFREYIAEPRYVGGPHQNNVFVANGFSVLTLTAGGQLAPVAPGGSLEIAVNFVPDGEGEFFGTLTIRTNVEGFDVTEIQMTGVGFVDAPPQISVAPEAINFGEVLIGERGTDRITIRNTGGGVLVVGDILSDNEVFGVEWNGAELGAGQSINATVFFVPADEERYEGQLRIVSNDPDEQNVTVDLAGAGVGAAVPIIAFDPEELLDFGNVLLGENGAIRLNVMNVGRADLTVSRVISDNDVFTHDFENPQEGPRYQFRQTDVSHSLLVQETNLNGDPLQIDDEIGVFTEGGLCAGSGTVVEVGAQVGLGAFGDDAQTQEVDGFRANEAFEFRFWDASAFREYVAEAQYVGGPHQNGVFVANGFTVLNLSAGERLDPADVAEVVVAPGEGFEVNVVFTPTEEGGYEGTLTVFSNDQENPEATLRMVGVGYEYRPPVIVVDPEDLDFGDVMVGESEQHVILVVNEGGEDLEIAVSSTNEAFGVGEYRDVIAPNEDIDIFVTFRPEAAEEYTGEIVITSNDPDNDEVRVFVQGVGTERPAPDIELSDNAYDFGEILVGESDRWVLGVRNVGNADLMIGNAFIEGDGFIAELQNDILQPDQSTEVYVTFAPEEEMDYEARLVITSNDPDEAEVFVALNGTGYVEAAPEISVDVDGLDFGAVELNQVAEIQVTVSNTGDAALIIDAIESDNAVFWTDYEDEPPVGPRFRFRQTDVSHSLLVQDATLNGEPLDVDDEIGVFTEGGLCGGASVVAERGADLGIGVFADDAQTQEVDGFQANEAFEFRIWDVSSRREIVAQPEYRGGPHRDFRFVANGFTVMTLTAGEGLNPVDIAETVIEPGEEMVFTVFFGPEEAGEYEGMLTIFSNDPSAPELGIRMVGVGGVHAPMIELSAEAHEFGALLVGDSEEWTLTIRNAGDDDLIVEDVITEGDYFIDDMDGFRFTLEPGASQDAMIFFAPEDAGAFEGSVTIISNDPQNGEARVSLAGQGLWYPVARLTPEDGVDFGRVIVGEISDGVFNIHNDGLAPLTVSEIIVEGDYFSLDPDFGGGEEPGHFNWQFNRTDVSLNVLVRAAMLGDESLVEGDFVGVFTPAGACAGFSEVPAGFPDENLGLAVWAAEGQNPGFRAGEQLNYRFWDVSVGREYEAQAEYIQGNGRFEANAFFVANLVSDGRHEGMNVAEWVIEPDGVLEVPVFFLPEEAGEFEGMITVISNDRVNGELTAPMFGVGYYLPPEIVVSEMAHDFGDVNVGEAAEWSFTIENNGQLDLEIGDLSIEGDGFVLHHDAAFAIAGGGMEEIPVMFEPDHPGEFAATITILSNDPENGELMVDVRGVGTAAVMVLNDNRFDFGEVFTGEEGVLDIIISNEGNADLVIEDMFFNNEAFDVEIGAAREFDWRYQRSDVSMNILVQEAMLGRDALTMDDYIGVFTADGVCAGFGQPDDQGRTGLSAWGAENDDPGFRAGNELTYRFWDVSANREFRADVEYINGYHGNFEVNGFAVANLYAGDRFNPAAFEGPVVVAPGAEVSGLLYFRPAEEMEYDGLMTIVSNNFGNPEVEVGLFGVGVVPNHPPFWVDVPEADQANEGDMYELVVVAGDDDGDELMLSLVDLGGNLPMAVEDMFVDNGDGSGAFTWEMDFEAAGEYSLQFIVNDGTESVSTVLNLMVMNVNRAPEFVEYPMEDIVVNEMEEVRFDLVAIDLDNDYIDMSYDGDVPDGLDFRYDGEGNGSFYWIPAYHHSGEYTAHFTANDGDLADDVEVHIIVNNVNRAPEVVQAIEDLVVDEDCGYTVIADLNEVFVDPDGDELSFDIAEGIDELGLMIVDGILSLEPTDNYFGASGVLITADDGHDGEMFVATAMINIPAANNNRALRAVRNIGQMNSTPNRDIAVEDMFQITVVSVNDEPVVVEAIDDVVIDEDHGMVVIGDLDDMFADVEDDALDFSFAGAPDELNMVIDEDNVLYFEASENFNLPDGTEIVVRAVDADGADVTDAFMVTINAVNDAPIVVDDIDDIVVDEDSDRFVVVDDLNDIFFDVDQDELMFELLEAGPAGLNMVLEGVELSFNPDPEFTLPNGAEIIVSASDAEEMVEIMFMVTVVPINDMPEWTLVPDQIVSVDETEIVEFSLAAEDLDGDVLEYILEAEGLPEEAMFTDNGDGTADFYWETSHADYGWYDLRFVLSDGVEIIDFEMSIEVINTLQHFEYPAISDVSHNLLIQDLILDGESVPVDWEIGVVTPGGVIAGAEPWNADGEGVGVAVWGDDQGTEEVDGFHAGETMAFVVWDPIEDREYRGEAHVVQGGINWETNGFTVMTLEALVSRDLTIAFRTGWNLISLNVSPGDEFYAENEARGPDVRMMLAQFQDEDAHHVLLLKNDRGRFYYPGIDFSNIPYWNLEEGYAIRLDAATEGMWSGEPIPADAEFPIYHGWNYVPYYPTYELSARSPQFYVLSPIIEYVILAKNGLGRFMAPNLEYPFSNMPDWRETQGYQVRLDLEGREFITFSYPEQAGGVAVAADLVAPVESHYTELVSTGANMSVLVSSISGVSYSAYDEIAAYATDGRYVGYGTIDENGQCGIAVWGDDVTTSEVEGLIEGESFELRLWDSRSNTEVGLLPTAVHVGTGLNYTTDDFVLLDVTMKPVIPEEYYLSQAYPNPFNAITRLTYGMPEEGMVSVKVFDLSGRLVSTLVNEVHTAGVHTALWNGEGLVSGIYIIRFETNGFHSARKVALVK